MATEGGAARRRYQDGYRRMLVDMHIPDWDEAFLSAYDPAAMAELYVRAGVNSVMLYCKSHAGLCYWPASTGRMHGGLCGRDVVGELVGHLRDRDIGVCAYHSVVFDNWAAEAHPSWRQRTLSGNDQHAAGRYGWCCINNPDYRAYEQAQLQELLTRYEFDALFLDMIFWPIVCACDHCRARWQAESGEEIPVAVSWTSPSWCAFQAARERWSDELTATLAATAAEAAPGIAVTHNLAPALFNWGRAQPLAACRHDTFVAGDLYGDAVEQLMISKLMLHLGQQGPPEFMTSRSVNLGDHVRLKGRHAMHLAASAATATSAAFAFIDAVDPIGTINEAVFGRIGEIFGELAPYEPFLGGNPLEDVAVYLSDSSQMDLAEEGAPVDPVHRGMRRFPHVDAVRGACRALQRAHIPFGVITENALDSLDQFRVVILPNLVRMSSHEAAAFRSYVAAGGRLYASRWTSLLETSGTMHDDFLLSDVFGASYDGPETGPYVYSKPAHERIAARMRPQTHLSHASESRGLGVPIPSCDLPRLRANPKGSTLATLTLPYGYPSSGSVEGHDWASIHSSPPWTDLDAPTIVSYDFGDGRTVYSAADIERIAGDAEESVFVGIVLDLLETPPSLSADAHPAVWMSGFDQPDRSQLMVSFLHHAADPPGPAVAARFTLRPPDGRRFVSLRAAPSNENVPFESTSDGALTAEIAANGPLALVVAGYV